MRKASKTPHGVGTPADWIACQLTRGHESFTYHEPRYTSGPNVTLLRRWRECYWCGHYEELPDVEG